MPRGARVGDAEWDELRRGMALRVGLALSAVLMLAVFAEMQQGPDGLPLLPITLGLSLAMAFVALTSRGSATMVGLGEVALALGAAWLVYFTADTDAGRFLVLIPVLLAACLLPPEWGLPTAAGAGLLAVAAAGPAGSAQGAYLLLTLLLVVCGTIGNAMARGALRRAWSQAERTATLAREVRLRQEEVNRLNKALKVSNGLLKRSLGELALAQREADEARHLKEQFATTVSHELRTPLNIILGFVEVMQRYPEVYTGAVWTPALRRDVAEVQRSARYLSELVDDILDLARLQALRMPIHRERSSIAHVVEEAVGLATRLLAADNRVAITADIPSDLPSLYVDRTRIRQVLLNLLANACRFTEAGSVRVEAVRDDDSITVSVADTGPGVPPEQLETIFEEFRQAPAAGREAVMAAGKGLGLAIARRFIQMHGGQMWVESRVGEGSTFRFCLPVQDKQVVNLGTPHVSAMPRSDDLPVVVLVDEPEGEAYLRRHLEGYTVLRAADMVEARELVLREHPSAVIVNDYQQPGSAVGPPGEHSLGECVPTPVLWCVLPGGHRLQPGDLYDEWLVKPVDSDRLLAALRRFAGRHRVLIVDDDASFARLVRRILEAQPEAWNVDWVENGREALAVLAGAEFDVVLLDIALPGMSGRAVAQQIRDQFAHRVQSVVAVTAYQLGVEDGERQARGFGVTLSSGLSEDDTLHLIRACLTCLRPDYARWPPAAEPEAAVDGTRA